MESAYFITVSPVSSSVSSVNLRLNRPILTVRSPVISVPSSLMKDFVTFISLGFFSEFVIFTDVSGFSFSSSMGVLPAPL